MTTTSGERRQLRDHIATAISGAVVSDQADPQGWRRTASIQPDDALALADRVLVNLGVYPLGCLDPLGGFHMATNEEHEHEEGDPGCRLVVALSVYFGGRDT